MNRRDFLKYSTTSLLGFALADRFAILDARRRIKKGTAYSIVMLGDTHYDTAPDTVYHTGYSDPDPVREANHRKEFARNANMWADRCPRLLKRAACLVDDSTRMTIQVGDLIQGDCGDMATHEKFLDDAFNMMKGALGAVPMVTVAGNHDLRGRDDKEATAAYEKYMPERISRELGKKISKTTYAFMIDKDAYICIDFTHPDYEELDRLLEQTEKARYTFIISHSPLFPCQGKSYSWTLFGRNSNKETRLRYRELFARRNAIIICGHTHTTELHQWEGDGGKITQMTINSVWASEKNARYEVITDKVEDYCAKNPKKGQEMADEIKPCLKEWSISKACGSYKMMVSDEGVYVDFYAGDSSARTERFILR